MNRHLSAPIALGLGALATALALTACGGGGGGGPTHAQGEEAVVGYANPTSGVRTTLGITVLDVRKGTQEELKAGGLEVDPEDQDTTPYYVDVRYENQGQQTIKQDVSVGLEDSDGNLIGSTLIFDFGGKPFEPCKNINEGELPPGKSFEDCTLFLVPEGTDVAKVHFLSDKGAGNEPEFVYWDAG